MKYVINIIWALLATYLCQVSITSATDDKVIAGNGAVCSDDSCKKQNMWFLSVNSEAIYIESGTTVTIER